MILIKPSFEIWTPVAQIQACIIKIEKAGRICYKSESPERWDETKKFVTSLIKKGHESVIEHFNITVKFVVDRGVTHELVRHRLASYSQESTRYCNYKGGVTFIIPPWTNFLSGTFTDSSNCVEYWDSTKSERIWFCAMVNAEADYQNLLKEGWTPQQARSVLPNSLKTEIVMTANLREWRHVFKLRTSPAAHPQMREIMMPLLEEFKRLIPAVFDDIEAGYKEANKKPFIPSFQEGTGSGDI